MFSGNESIHGQFELALTADVTGGVKLKNVAVHRARKNFQTHSHDSSSRFFGVLSGIKRGPSPPDSLLSERENPSCGRWNRGGGSMGVPGGKDPVLRRSADSLLLGGIGLLS